MYHIRQFVATFAKKIKEQNKELKEARIKVEGAAKKTETQESKVNSTRQSIVDIIEKFQKFEDNLVQVD